MYKALMIGAHNDECEFGLGGIACLLREAGVQVRTLIVAAKWHAPLSEAEKEETRRQETRAGELLGVEKRVIGDREASTWMETPETVCAIEKEIHDFRPDIAFIHWPQDNPAEHREAAKASLRALTVAAPHGTRVREVYAFEAGPNQSMVFFRPDLAIDVTEAMPAVRESLRAYHQAHAQGDGLCREKEVSAAFRGHVCGAKYAEALKIVKFPDGGQDFLLRQLLGERFRWWGNAQYPAYGYLYF